MSWRQRLQQGSFRGVRFEVTDTDLGGARRKSVLPVPGRDEPFIQDLGGAPRMIRVEALLVGADFLDHLDRLLDALRAPGKGKLVHPTMGEHQASVTNVNVRQSNQTLGSATLSIEFIVGGIETALVGTTIGRDTIGAIGTSITAAASGALSTTADSARNQELDIARGASLAIGGELELEVARLSRLDLLLDRGQDLSEYLTTLKTLIDLPLRTGSDWALWLSRASGSTSSLSSFYSSRLAAFQGLLGIALRLLGIDDGGSRTARAARTGAGAAALSESAIAAAEVEDDWESQDEADSARDQLLEATDIVLSADLPELIEPILDLRAAIVASVPAPSASLPQISFYLPASVEPAVISAYRAYDDPSADAELVRRNRISHPAFVPARNLEVLLSV